MNRLYKIGIIGLVVIFAYYEWLYVFRNAGTVFSNFGVFIVFQKAVFTSMFSSLLTWIATVVGRYLDEEGYVGDSEYENLKVGIIDIGGGTTDLDIVDSLQRQPNYTSIPKGFSDVYSEIRKVIVGEYPSLEITDYEILNCLKEKKYKPSKREKEIDFSKALDNGIKEVVVDIQTAILSKWKDQTDMDEILLIGASAKEFEDKLSNVVTGLTIPENHDVSNVEGYFRWGMNQIGDDE